MYICKYARACPSSICVSFSIFLSSTLTSHLLTHTHTLSIELRVTITHLHVQYRFKRVHYRLKCTTNFCSFSSSHPATNLLAPYLPHTITHRLCTVVIRCRGSCRGCAAGRLYVCEQIDQRAGTHLALLSPLFVSLYMLRDLQCIFRMNNISSEGTLSPPTDTDISMLCIFFFMPWHACELVSFSFGVPL